MAGRSKIDFLISNDRHHVEMFEPVLRELAKRSEFERRVVSLCEFRGLETPVQRFENAGVPALKLSPRFRSSSSSGSQKGGGTAKFSRKVLRWLSWELLLRRAVAQWLASKPDLVLLGNDSAFPYDRITAQLRKRNIPFVLVQEGIRFRVPAGEDFDFYGKGGAAAVAAWGESSAAFFRAQGVPNERIHLTGNPRFDGVAKRDWKPETEALRIKLGVGNKNLLFLSNPIDDQGFCTTAEKVALIERFVRASAALFDDPEFYLILKLHGRESLEDVSAAITPLPFASRTIVTKDAPLYPLFGLGAGAVVLASTVGLEALMFGLPLGVLEIPPWGFAFDYVSKGGAMGISTSDPVAEQIKTLVHPTLEKQEAAQRYLEYALARRDGAASAVAELVVQVVGGRA